MHKWYDDVPEGTNVAQETRRLPKIHQGSSKGTKVAQKAQMLPKCTKVAQMHQGSPNVQMLSKRHKWNPFCTQIMHFRQFMPFWRPFMHFHHHFMAFDVRLCFLDSIYALAFINEPTQAQLFSSLKKTSQVEPDWLQMWHNSVCKREKMES